MHKHKLPAMVAAFSIVFFLASCSGAEHKAAPDSYANLDCEKLFSRMQYKLDEGAMLFTKEEDESSVTKLSVDGAVSAAGYITLGGVLVAALVSAVVEFWPLFAVAAVVEGLSKLSGAEHEEPSDAGHEELSDAKYEELSDAEHEELSDAKHEELSDAGHEELSDAEHEQLRKLSDEFRIFRAIAIKEQCDTSAMPRWELGY